MGCTNLTHETVYASETNNTVETFSDIALDRRTSLIQDVTLPDSQYEAQTVIPITSGWRLVGMQHNFRIWETALPIRSRFFFPLRTCRHETAPSQSGKHRMGYRHRIEVQQTHAQICQHMEHEQPFAACNIVRLMQVLQHLGNTQSIIQKQQNKVSAFGQTRTPMIPKPMSLDSSNLETIRATDCTYLHLVASPIKSRCQTMEFSALTLF